MKAIEQVVTNMVGKRQPNYILPSELGFDGFEASLSIYKRLVSDYGDKVWCYHPIPALACRISDKQFLNLPSIPALFEDIEND